MTSCSLIHNNVIRSKLVWYKKNKTLQDIQLLDGNQIRGSTNLATLQHSAKYFTPYSIPSHHSLNQL